MYFTITGAKNNVRFSVQELTRNRMLCVLQSNNLSLAPITFSRKILIAHFLINYYHNFYSITSLGSPPGFGLLNNDLSLSSSEIAPLARI